MERVVSARPKEPFLGTNLWRCGPPLATPDGVVIDQSITFSWNFPNSVGETISCSLDIEPDGIVDYVFPDCIKTTSVTRPYPVSGQFEPLFIARNQFGESAVKYHVVTIRLGKIGTDLGRSVFIEGKWHVIIGGALFGVLP